MSILSAGRRPGEGFNLKSWIMLPVALALLGTIGLGIVCKYRQSTEGPRREMALIMSQSRAAWRQIQKTEAAMLESHLEYLAAHPELIQAYRDRDRDRLIDLARPMADRLRRRFRITHFYFIDPNQTCFLRVHHPARQGDRLNRHTLQEAVRSGYDSWGLELGPLGSFTLRFVRPWIVEGQLLGYLELGMEIDHLIHRLAAAHDVQIVALVYKQFVQPELFKEGQAIFSFPGRWNDYADFVIVQQTMAELPSALDSRLRRELLPPAGMAPGPTRQAGQWWWCGTLPQPDADGRKVAHLILLREVSQSVELARRELLLEISLGLLLATGVLLLLWQVTNRAQRLLADSFATMQNREQHLAAILDSIGDAVIVTNADGRVTQMNPVAEQLTGWSQSQGQRRPLPEVFRIFNAETDQEAENPVGRVLATGKLVELANHTLLKSRDGNTHQIADTAAPIRDRHGATRGVVLVFRDVSEEYRARIETERIRASLENAQRLAHLGNWEWDIPNNTLFWSREIYHIFGITPENFAASYQAFLARVHPEDRQMVRQAVDSALYDNQPYCIEHRLIHMDGTVRWVQEQAEVCRDENGHPLRMTGTVQDITERREIESRERQANKMQAIGLLAGGIAHDFNNLLTPIMMHAEMAQMEAAPQDNLDRHLEGIQQAARRAASLVRQILSFSRKNKEELKPVHLGPLVREAVRFLQATAPAHVSVSEDIKTQDDKVTADSAQILQVLMNLGINGIQAIGAGDGTLTLTLEQTAAPEKAASSQRDSAWRKISVRDNGCGIGPEELSNIFDPFFSTKKSGEGTGLGLSVVHGIISRHQGVIQVESEPGVGSCFKIYLPACVGEAETMATQPPLRHGRNELILLVDDDPALQESVATGLEHLGYRVVTAADGHEALTFLKSGRNVEVDLVLTDYDMPGLKGTELATAIQKIRIDLPVVLYTGAGSPINTKSLEEFNIAALLFKPLRLESLVHQIRHVLAKGNASLLKQ